MSSRSAIVPILGALLIAAAALAAEPQRADLVSEFVETYQPDVGVSGNIVTGVMWPSAAAGLAVDRVGIAPRAATTAGEICLRAVSRDGIYSSRNEYRLPMAAAGQLFLLPYRTQHGKLLRELADQNVAITATRGPCEASADTYYAVISAPAAPDDELHVYVNSFGATDVFYAVKSAAGWSSHAPCDYISEGRRTTFDHTCRLPAEPVRGGDVSVRILRERYGREQPPVEFRLIGSN